MHRAIKEMDNVFFLLDILAGNGTYGRTVSWVEERMEVFIFLFFLKYHFCNSAMHRSKA